MRNSSLTITVSGEWETETIDVSILMAAYKERNTTARGRRYIELFGDCHPEALPSRDDLEGQEEPLPNPTPADTTHKENDR